ncbi:hypothetical protein [Paractinoplanes toevensis]|uniref:Uncharacterized protein n=1 Tax=Paractinoplanes toevensis TaxID=571911 RepID=A0A920BQF5_9ACTN|nr:hypothetical protein [Actinoplanes toevensis]GIM97452.1 hypothetical protein Ato02nite_092450 [Actinoplanes toevensis]
MRRFLLVLSGLATATLGLVAAPTASLAAAPATATVRAAVAAAILAAPAPATVLGAPAAAPVAGLVAVSAATSCVSVAAATYRHSFNGAAGTTTITATRPLCAGQTQTFTLASYTTGAPNSASGQFIYDSDSDTITATNRSVTLKVSVPACYNQVEAFFGGTVQTEATSPKALYGSAKLGASSRSAGPLAWYTGGSTTCAARPAVAITNACDGTFTARLSNTGTTTAVFLTGSRRIRLSPGGTTTLKPAKGSTLTIRDSSFTTHIATWRAPADCTAIAPTLSPTTAAPLPTQPAPSATATTTPASPSASASTSASPYESPNPAFSTNPAALTPANSSDISDGGMSTTSIIAIIMGLLMIATGAAAITWLVRMNRQPA